MKIAAPYTNNEKWRDIPDEYNILYKKTSTIEKVRSFCETYPNKRINVCFYDGKIEENDLLALTDRFDNLYIRVLPNQMSMINFYRKHGIKFFFDASMPCYSGSMLDFFIKAGVTDIYIYDSLWYNLPLVAQRCKKCNIHIRLILNRIPSLRPDAGRDVCAPLFSPKDADYLSQYVDTAEFDCYVDGENQAYNWHKFNVFYKAWFIDKKWYGYLEDINKDVRLPIPVLSLPNNFIHRRCECGRRCSLGITCRHCGDYINLANNLHASGIYFEGQKNKNDIE